MKKYILFSMIFGLLFAFSSLAANTTLTGKVTVINLDSTNPNLGSFTIIKNLNWFQKLTGAIFNKPQETPITIQVTLNTKFSLRTSKEAGFTEGSFADLKVNDPVVVTADLTNSVYTALEVKITGRFIPVPKPIAPIKQCQTDADCVWCGRSCVNKTEIVGKYCPQVMPNPGSSCQCVNNRCLVIPLTGPNSTSTPPNTFQNKDQILREMNRIKDQIKVLEQRLKELEKLLKTVPATSTSTTQ